MKKYLSVVTFIAFYSISVYSQNVTILKPGPSDGKDAYVLSRFSPTNTHDVNYGDYTVIKGGKDQVISGHYDNFRSFFQFDLSDLPPYAIVTNATLNLYASYRHYGDNTTKIYRVLEPWEEDSITWNNQPPYSTYEPVVLRQSTSVIQDYSVDLTWHIQDMVRYEDSNYGFAFIRLPFGGDGWLYFASSDDPDPNDRPELIITWVPNVNSEECLWIRPDSLEGIDAWVTNAPGDENTNFSNHKDLGAASFPDGGGSFISRSYFDFDLSFVPSNTTITSAELSLYHNPDSNSFSSGHQSLTGPNNVVLQRVLSPWSDSTITWNNQPSTTTGNQVFIAQSDSSNQDYPNIDVRGLISDLLATPNTSFGIQMKLQNESGTRNLVFASSDHDSIFIRPTLKVCYDAPVGREKEVLQSEKLFVENPVEGESISLRWELLKKQELEISLIDLNGRELWQSGSFIAVPNGEFQIPLSNLSLSPGIYLVRMQGKEVASTSKVVVGY